MRVQSLIVCEDIRMEMGTKYILLGVYDSDLIVNATQLKPPIPIALAVFARLYIEEGDLDFDSLQLESFLDKRSVGNILGPISYKDRTKLITIQARLEPIVIEKSADVSFKLRLFKDGRLVSEVDPKYTLHILLNAPNLVPA